MPVKCCWNSMFSDELWISRRDIVSASASSAPFSLLNRTFLESNGAIAETCAQEDNNLLLLIWFTLMTRNNNSTHNAWASTQLQNDLEVCFVGWSQFYTWVAKASGNDLLVATRICNLLYLNFMLVCDIQIDFFAHEKKLNWTIEFASNDMTTTIHFGFFDKQMLYRFRLFFAKNANHSINQVLHICVRLEMKW